MKESKLAKEKADKEQNEANEAEKALKAAKRKEHLERIRIQEEADAKELLEVNSLQASSFITGLVKKAE